MIISKSRHKRRSRSCKTGSSSERRGNKSGGEEKRRGKSE
jgi:hypothetical protein